MNFAVEEAMSQHNKEKITDKFEQKIACLLHRLPNEIGLILREFIESIVNSSFNQ